jgi:two-component system, LytTR family, response regulator LytT
VNVLIVEDEALAIDWLRAQLREVEASANVVGEVDSVKNAVEWLRTMPRPDLAFMDIQLADGLSFEIFAQIPVLMPVIFTTSFDEFALQAFKVHSIDYLLKPINKLDLQRSLAKYKQLQEVYAAHAALALPIEGTMSPDERQSADEQTSADMDANINANVNANILRLVEQLLQTQQMQSLPQQHHESRLLVFRGSKMLPVMYEEIAFISSENKLTYVTTHDGKRYIKNRSLDELETLLPRHLFFRINRQFIVHITAISSVQTQQSGRLKVQISPPPSLNTDEGRDTFVSRERLSDFKAWIGR